MTQTRTWRSGALLAVALAAPALGGACSAAGGEAAPEPDLGTAHQPIINGDASDVTQNAVVLLVNVDEGYGCSGTLLAPNLVLTARHCVSRTADDAFACFRDGTGTDGGTIGADYDPSSLLVSYGVTRPTHTVRLGGLGARIFHDDATNLCNHDLALLLLDRSIDGAAIAPVRVDGLPSVGEELTLVGWGVTTKTPLPTDRQERAGVPVLHVGPDAIPADNLDVPGNEFTIGEGTCSGDSGGPALSASGAVVGVVSRGGNGVNASDADPSATCLGGDNFLTELAPFKSLILQAYQAAGQTPLLDPGGTTGGGAAFGDTCTADTDCASALCDVEGASSGICTIACATGSCPGGYACTGGSTPLCVPSSSSMATSGTGGLTSGSSGGGCEAAPSSHAEGRSYAAASLLVGALGASFLRRQRRKRH